MISHLTIGLLTLQTIAGKTFYQNDNNYQVNQNIQQQRKVYSEVGQNLTISCTNPSPWFFCVWEGPRGDRLCGLRDKLGSGQAKLCGEEERYTISGQLPAEKLTRPHTNQSDSGNQSIEINSENSTTRKSLWAFKLKHFENSHFNCLPSIYCLDDCKEIIPCKTSM